MASVTIRPGVPGDRDALRTVFRRASLSNAADRAALLANPEVLLWDGEALAEGRTRVAADDDGAVVGFASIVRIGAAAELEDLFVDPGRMRQGIGRRLVEDAIRLAQAQGVDRLQVTANPHAMAFYESVGFTHDGVAQTRFGPAPRMRLDVVCSPPPPSARRSSARTARAAAARHVPGQVERAAAVERPRDSARGDGVAHTARVRRDQ